MAQVLEGNNCDVLHFVNYIDKKRWWKYFHSANTFHEKNEITKKQQINNTLK